MKRCILAAKSFSGYKAALYDEQRPLVVSKWLQALLLRWNSLGRSIREDLVMGPRVSKEDEKLLLKSMTMGSSLTSNLDLGVNDYEGEQIVHVSEEESDGVVDDDDEDLSESEEESPIRPNLNLHFPSSSSSSSQEVITAAVPATLTTTKVNNLKKAPKTTQVPESTEDEDDTTTVTSQTASSTKEEISVYGNNAERLLSDAEKSFKSGDHTDSTKLPSSSDGGKLSSSDGGSGTLKPLKGNKLQSDISDNSSQNGVSSVDSQSISSGYNSSVEGSTNRIDTLGKSKQNVKLTPGKLKKNVPIGTKVPPISGPGSVSSGGYASGELSSQPGTESSKTVSLVNDHISIPESEESEILDALSYAEQTKSTKSTQSGNSDDGDTVKSSSAKKGYGNQQCRTQDEGDGDEQSPGNHSNASSDNNIGPLGFRKSAVNWSLLSSDIFTFCSKSRDLKTIKKMMVFIGKKILIDREIAGLQFNIFKYQSNAQLRISMINTRISLLVVF